MKVIRIPRRPAIFTNTTKKIKIIIKKKVEIQRSREDFVAVELLKVLVQT